MTGLAAILGCLLAAVEISVSPDQPLGYSYIDDPLILEIQSDAPCTADIEVVLQPPTGEAAIRRTFPAITLGPEINRWCAIKELPVVRGPWDIAVSVDGGGGESVHNVVVYRIDRPAGAYAHPLFAYGDTINRETLLALRSVSVGPVRIPATHPELGSLLEDVEALGMKAIVWLDSPVDAVATATDLAALRCGAIARWELNATAGDAEALVPVIEALQGLPCSLPISLGIRDAAPIEALRAAGATSNVEHLVVYGGEEGPRILDQIRADLAALGDESPELEYLTAGEQQDAFLATYFEALAHGAMRVGMPARLVAEGGVLQPGLASLNGLVHGIPPSDFAGRLPAGDGISALVFSRGEAWTMAFWAEKEDATLSLTWSGPHPPTLWDSWNNSLTIEVPEGESWECPASPAVRILRGSDGPILKAALVAEVKARVKRLLARNDLAPVWTEAVKNTLQAVGAEPINDQSRVHFFALLRAIPDIEEHWHAGELTRPVAVAALAGLAELARTLCRVEAARGATFLEPIQDTLARCEEYQSRYLTGSTSSPQARARGDWLVEEVRRLMDEVESLLASGAKIEADAVAALAEWRARGLEFAAKAGPLSDQTSLPEPKAEATPTDTKKGKE